MPSMVGLITYLEANKVQPAGTAANLHSGPIRSLYEVTFEKLKACPDTPGALTELIKGITTVLGAYDKGEQTSRNDDRMGAMRQIHSNSPAWLPSLGQSAGELNKWQKDMADARTEKKLESLIAKSLGTFRFHAQAYNDYVTQNKRQTNDNGGSNIGTGYVEFTASELGMYQPDPPLRSRIVYDYIGRKIYFSPIHYHSWTISGGVLTPISGKDVNLGPNAPNAFYYISGT